MTLENFVSELRQEAVRARDEHGNTDFYVILKEAADRIESLQRLNLSGAVLASPLGYKMTNRCVAIEASVNDIPDNELLSRAVRNCRRGRSREKLPLWSVVSNRFALGSTFAAELCRRFGLDPDEQVRR